MNMRIFVTSLTREEREELTKELKVVDDGGLTNDEKRMSTIEAIRSVRNRTGLGLMMAKQLIERSDRVDQSGPRSDQR